MVGEGEVHSAWDEEREEGPVREGSEGEGPPLRGQRRRRLSG